MSTTGEVNVGGAFKNVGGKAGGFISKKFFHPSSFRNQEKLWLAQTNDERETKRQNELEKRREEERAVEDLRKQMYLSGQGKSSDFDASSKEAMMKNLAPSQKQEQSEAVAEQKRRMAMIKSQRASAGAAQASPGDEDEEEDAEDGKRKLAKSRYFEDVHVLGHSAVWGSWYSTEDKKWGFGCCKVSSKKQECPNAPEEEDPEAGLQVPKSKRRRGDRGGAGDASGSAPPGVEGGLRRGGKGGGGGADSSKPLLDPKLLEAHAKRMDKKRLDEEMKQEEKKRDRYLGSLLADPSNQAEP